MPAPRPKEVVMSLSLIKRSLFLTVLVAAMGGGRANAQDVVGVRVPFDFVVRGHMFPSGSYKVTINAAGEGVMSLREDRGKAFTFALTIPVGGRDPAGDQPALVFNRHENTYVLSQVWENRTQGCEIMKG
jgi:hypothetical protein